VRGGPDQQRPIERDSAIDAIARALQGDLSWTREDRWNADTLAEEAERHGVDLVLWHVLHARADGPVGLTERLAVKVGPEAARAAIRERELTAVSWAFEAHQVPALVVKGAALAYTRYAKPWLRPRLDTDVLVDRSAFDRAAAALEHAGYARSATFSTGDFVSHQVAYERTDDYGVEHTIDLHWRALNPQLLAGVVEFADLWEEAEDVPVGAASIRVPTAFWSLLLACAHRLAHHQRHERLIWLYDLHLLAGVLPESRWNHLVAVARERRIAAICADGLGTAARRLGTPVPAAVLAALTYAGRSEPTRHYVDRDVSRLDVLRDDLRELPWRDRGRLLREHLFPPAAFIRSRYGTESSLLLPLLYAHRLMTGAVKWIRT